ncbi:MAG: multidrug effflux MFS transporter [Bradymonadia bacterium]
MRQNEFVALMALLMSFVALSIDAMLPALGHISVSLGITNANDVQWVITSIFLGMSVGLLLYGPLSDAYGRKPAIYLGVSIFLVGCVLSYLSGSFEVMLAGRVLQGLGAASARVVTTALIRDRFEGNQMARIMSLIVLIFILVPALAPMIGQGILLIGDWRDIFAFMMALGLVGVSWFAIRQEETLPKARRLPFSLPTMMAGARETLSHPVARGFTLASGLVFGAFIGYLVSAQQILQVQYALGERFPYAFGGLALCVGGASYVNSRWVESVGMLKVCVLSLKGLSALAVAFVGVAVAFDGHPPMVAFLLYLGGTFFCFGLLYGNFNALAVQPMGHIAGIASSIIAAVQTLLSVLLGGLIGGSYNGTVLPLVLGFLVLGIAALALTTRVGRLHMTPEG